MVRAGGVNSCVTARKDIRIAERNGFVNARSASVARKGIVCARRILGSPLWPRGESRHAVTSSIVDHDGTPKDFAVLQVVARIVNLVQCVPASYELFERELALMVPPQELVEVTFRVCRTE